jgi:hypothetical protein
MTILMPVYLRASYHRHVHRHRVNRIGKPLPRYHDGRDAYDGLYELILNRGCISTS